MKRPLSKTKLKITFLKSHSDLPGSNELNGYYMVWRIYRYHIMLIFIFPGFALVLNNGAAPSDQSSWSYLFTPTVELTETSCLGFYTKLIPYVEFEVRLVWSDSRSIYTTDGSIAGLNKVNRFSFPVALIARSMGPTWGQSGADRTQVGPMLAPWTLLSEWALDFSGIRGE